MDEILNNAVNTTIPLLAKCHVASRYTLGSVLDTMKILRTLALEDNSEEGSQFYDELVEQMKPVLQDKVREYVKGYAQRENTAANMSQTMSSACNIALALAQTAEDEVNPFDVDTPPPRNGCPCDNTQSEELLLDELMDSIRAVRAAEQPVTVESESDNDE